MKTDAVNSALFYERRKSFGNDVRQWESLGRTGKDL
jgi:hypothetical protein